MNINRRPVPPEELEAAAAAFRQWNDQTDQVRAWSSVLRVEENDETRYVVWPDLLDPLWESMEQVIDCSMWGEPLRLSLIHI